MLYMYKLKNNEYIVKIINEAQEVADIEFIKRVNGGKGRLPKNKLVLKEDLTLLVNMDIVKELASR